MTCVKSLNCKEMTFFFSLKELLNFFQKKKKKSCLEKEEKVDGKKNLTCRPSLESSMLLPVHLLRHTSFQGFVMTSTLQTKRLRVKQVHWQPEAPTASMDSGLRLRPLSFPETTLPLGGYIVGPWVFPRPPLSPSSQPGWGDFPLAWHCHIMKITAGEKNWRNKWPRHLTTSLYWVNGSRWEMTVNRVHVLLTRSHAASF